MIEIQMAKRSAVQTVSRERRLLAVVGNTQVGLWVVRSLGGAGLSVYAVCTSPHGLSAHSRYAAGAWVINVGPNDPAWIEQIEALARELNVGSILTIAESYHAALIRERERFEPDIHVFSPPAECFWKVSDKDYMHRLCEQLGVPVARGTTLDAVMADPGRCGLRLPLVLRTRNYNDPEAPNAPWMGAAYALDKGQFENLCETVRDRASNILVHEYHTGITRSVQVLMHKGQPPMTGEYIGEHHMPLAGGVTVQRVSSHDPRLHRDAIRLLQAIRWEGAAGVQFHYQPRTKRYIFVEVNPTFLGGLPTVIKAGFDVPFLLWQNHFEPDRIREARYHLRVRTRVLGGDINWLGSIIRGDAPPPGQGRMGRLSAALRFLWNCGPWTGDDVFSLDDIKPFYIDVMQMGRKARQRAWQFHASRKFMRTAECEEKHKKELSP